MKIVVNKLGRPLRVPLPQGKVLHLGPKQEGQVADNAAEHPPFVELVEAGQIELFDGSESGHHEHDRGGTVRDRTHGVGRKAVHTSGDR